MVFFKEPGRSGSWKPFGLGSRCAGGGCALPPKSAGLRQFQNRSDVFFPRPANGKQKGRTFVRPLRTHQQNLNYRLPSGCPNQPSTMRGTYRNGREPPVTSTGDAESRAAAPSIRPRRMQEKGAGLWFAYRHRNALANNCPPLQTRGQLSHGQRTFRVRPQQSKTHHGVSDERSSAGSTSLICCALRILKCPPSS